VFAAYQANLNKFDLQLGLREDDNEEFGTTTTANIATGYAINEQYKVILSYGEGFKAPTFNDLYWPIGLYSYGNPDLVPETSENYEVELRAAYENLQWSANIYRNNIDNLIDWAQDETFAYTPTNIDSVQIEGIELAASTEISGWKLRSAINYTQPEDKITGYTLVKRPEKSATFELDKNFNKTDIGISWQVSSERYSDASNTTSTAGFGLVNFRVAHQITDAFKAQLKINNIFDKDYQTNSGYNQDRVNWFVTLTYSL
jgi:vitamin B12 transporter